VTVSLSFIYPQPFGASTTSVATTQNVANSSLLTFATPPRLATSNSPNFPALTNVATVPSVAIPDLPTIVTPPRVAATGPPTFAAFPNVATPPRLATFGSLDATTFPNVAKETMIPGQSTIVMPQRVTSSSSLHITGVQSDFYDQFLALDPGLGSMANMTTVAFPSQWDFSNLALDPLLASSLTTSDIHQENGEEGIIHYNLWQKFFVG